MLKYSLIAAALIVVILGLGVFFAPQVLRAYMPGSLGAACDAKGGKCLSTGGTNIGKCVKQVTKTVKVDCQKTVTKTEKVPCKKTVAAKCAKGATPPCTKEVDAKCPQEVTKQVPSKCPQQQTSSVKGNAVKTGDCENQYICYKCPAGYSWSLY